MIEIERVFETHITGAEILLNSLIDEGITTLFGIPGGAISPVFDLLLDTNLSHFLMRHEQAAAHAADGFFRASGRMAVALATSGPGCLNLTTGIATAYKDRSTLLAITGQTPTYKKGTDSFQEIDPAPIFSPIVKQTVSITTPQLVEYFIRNIMKVGYEFPQGPVHIDLPRDVQTNVTKWLPRVDHQFCPVPRVPYEDIERVAFTLCHAQYPAIIIGGGVIRSQVCSEVYRLSHLLSCPVVTTMMGKSGFPEYDPLFHGMIGGNGSTKANEIIQQADHVLALGTRLTDRTVWNSVDFAPRADIISVNIEQGMGVQMDNTQLLQGDLREVIPLLIELIPPHLQPNRWGEFLTPPPDQSDDRTVHHPVSIIKILRRVFPHNSIFVADTGQHQIFTANHLRVSKPATFITSGGLGCMGFGFPAALGAKLACPDCAVINITGDGSFLMMCQELATSMKYEIPVTVCIFNNGYLGMIRQSQLSSFNRISDVDLSPLPDFVKLAESFGAHGICVESMNELTDLDPYPEMTTVIDIPIDPSIPVPVCGYPWTQGR
ncbi:MAG: thiamine pyrophosphate-binding protein [Theionarchaea archaeon]|nr:thiamine pyrophosphate-binding protein [Theionarchaea archaeon]